MEAEKRTQEADERKQTWRCCTDLFLIEVDMHVNTSPKHMYLKAELSEAEADRKM